MQASFKRWGAHETEVKVEFSEPTTIRFPGTAWKMPIR